ncbi:MAG: molybdopterin oxidoreductase [Dehalococcoides mccartyi]|uniref:molybdopterin-dependent oxidoreductase n=1 Tax=Dehalococcoides mccartyi TaxID=61435 RepID=UPI0024324822|nr:molybdopterin-dependent oxidoreductase [Dehalococcoides mccartyi]MCF7634551.1 molybdopterin oxidoreductase [Dehalococcoides mccartyi]MEA2120785.1 Tetrathionate reductase subunit A [Dehalococcoides mccartyi]MEA2122389.1 Tetrathionate reductase subunit A [Dehalococcoides mccartyi]
MNKERQAENPSGGITRANFIKVSALLGGTALLSGCELVTHPRKILGDNDYSLSRPEDIIYSTCQQCATQCSIKVKLVDGVIAKVDGNPFSPWNMMPQLDYKTPVTTSALTDASICPKGHSGAQTSYDPFRLVKVIKRDGPRGSNKWKSIPFDQAVEEIASGGKLFSNVPGEENRIVEGLKDIWALRSPEVTKAINTDIKAIWAEKDEAGKTALVEAFKEKYRDYLDKFIDPNHPDLGLKNNGFCYMFGRTQGGRVDFIKRFTHDAMGSINAHGHTTVCQGSLFQSAKALSAKFDSATGEFMEGDKFYWMADIGKSEFVIFTGASPFEASFGPTSRAMRIADGLDSGRMKYAVADPRFSKAASKAWKWLPAKPGTEGALALALIRWIFDNNRYDAKYLANANKAAADADGEPTWSGSTWLVKIDAEGKAERFLRASDIGLEQGSFGFDTPLIMKNGEPARFDPNDTVNAAEGELLIDTVINGLRVKSSLQILRDEASSHTLEEWAEICGVKADDLAETASEFTSHGKKAAADVHRGVSQHTNGFYNALAWWNLNMLIGNYDWQGGMLKGSAYDISGSKAGGPFNLGKMKPGALTPSGINIVRYGHIYEDTTLFKSQGYPSKRNWYPLSEDIYQEVIPSAGDAYPYPIKALFLHMGSPVYVVPAGHTALEFLSDPEKLPLLVVTDIVVGETSMYADYIFPDLTNMERWEFAGSQNTIPFKSQPVRQPAIAPLVEIVKVFGQDMPLSMETMLLGLAEKMGLPGFGPDGLGNGIPLNHFDDLYIRMAANLAFGEKADGSDAVPDADEEEIRIFTQARRHLPDNIYNLERWSSLAGENWPKVVYMLNRGGRFQDYEGGYPANQQLGNKYGRLFNVFLEKTTEVKNSQTGAPIPGHACYITAGRDCYGQELNDEKNGYDLNLITYREIARTPTTAGNYYLNPLLPENTILINQADADRLGLTETDIVRVVSESNPRGVWNLRNGQEWPMNAKLNIMQGIRPGVVAFSLGYGHFAYGGLDITIDGELIPGEAKRTKGVNANAAMRVDPHLKNTCLVDTIGGSAVFYDTKVRLEKVNT